MSRTALLPLLMFAASCSSTSHSTQPELPEGVQEEDLVLNGPDGWLYVGIQREEASPEFVVIGDDARYSIPSAAYERFVPTLQGHVFALDEVGAWWHYASGERLGSMPWVDMRPTGDVQLNDGVWSGVWPVVLAEGGCAKVDHAGETIRAYPDAVRLELVGGCWIHEDALGDVTVEAPAGDPLTGGVRYVAPGGAPLIYLPQERAMFDPQTLETKRMDSVPNIRVLSAGDERFLLGIVPTFDNDATVALYDYYAGETRDRRLEAVNVVHVVEPPTSPHVQRGDAPLEVWAVLAEAADEDRWTAYELVPHQGGARLQEILSGTGGREWAHRLLEAELVSRHSHDVAPDDDEEAPAAPAE